MGKNGWWRNKRTLKVTPVFFSFEMMVTFDLPTWKMPPPIPPPPPPPRPPSAPPPPALVISSQKPMRRSVGATERRAPPSEPSDSYVTGR